MGNWKKQWHSRAVPCMLIEFRAAAVQFRAVTVQFSGWPTMLNESTIHQWGLG